LIAVSIISQVTLLGIVAAAVTAVVALTLFQATDKCTPPDTIVSLARTVPSNGDDQTGSAAVLVELETQAMMISLAWLSVPEVTDGAVEVPAAVLETVDPSTGELAAAPGIPTAITFAMFVVFPRVTVIVSVPATSGVVICELRLLLF
jgi:hypothetical protein